MKALILAAAVSLPFLLCNCAQRISPTNTFDEGKRMNDVQESTGNIMATGRVKASGS